MQLLNLNQIHLIALRDIQILDMLKFSFCQRVKIVVDRKFDTFDFLRVLYARKIFYDGRNDSSFDSISS